MNPLKPTWEEISEEWNMLTNFKDLIEGCYFFPVTLVQRDDGLYHVFGIFYNLTPTSLKNQLYNKLRNRNFIVCDLVIPVNLDWFNKCKILFCCEGSIQNIYELKIFLREDLYRHNENYLKALNIWRVKYARSTPTAMG